MDNLPDDKSLAFEEAFLQLKKIVDSLDSGDAGLEASLDNFEKGVGLLKLCREKLDVVSRRIELLKGVNEDDSLPAVEEIDENGNPLAQSEPSSIDSKDVFNEKTESIEGANAQNSVVGDPGDSDNGIEAFVDPANFDNQSVHEPSETPLKEDTARRRAASGKVRSGKRSLLDSSEAGDVSDKASLQQRSTFVKEDSASAGLPFEKDEPPF